MCDISDDWQQATANLSEDLHPVPSSLPLSVIRVFIVLSTQQPEDNVLCEVVAALLPLFLHACHLYPCDAMLLRLLAIIVCPSICLSHAGIVSKWLNIGSRKQCHMTAQGLVF